MKSACLTITKQAIADPLQLVSLTSVECGLLRGVFRAFRV